MKIKFFYEREDTSYTGERGLPVHTYCLVILPDGSELSGTAWCHTDDKCVKSIGRRVALSRALSSLTKGQRREIWSYYMKGRYKP